MGCVKKNGESHRCIKAVTLGIVATAVEDALHALCVRAQMKPLGATCATL